MKDVALVVAPSQGHALSGGDTGRAAAESHSWSGICRRVGVVEEIPPHAAKVIEHAITGHCEAQGTRVHGRLLLMVGGAIQQFRFELPQLWCGRAEKSRTTTIQDRKCG